MGAKIEGHGTSRIRIQGVERAARRHAPHRPDRIETGTFPVRGGGHRRRGVLLRTRARRHLDAVIDKLREAGWAMDDRDRRATGSA